MNNKPKSFDEVMAGFKPAAETVGCTCPSGDGSLRWPCPQHPTDAEKYEGQAIPEGMFIVPADLEQIQASIAAQIVSAPVRGTSDASPFEEKWSEAVKPKSVKEAAEQYATSRAQGGKADDILYGVTAADRLRGVEAMMTQTKKLSFDLLANVEFPNVGDRVSKLVGDPTKVGEFDDMPISTGRLSQELSNTQDIRAAFDAHRAKSKQRTSPDVERTKAVQEVLEEWLAELGLDVNSRESDAIAAKIMVAAAPPYTSNSDKYRAELYDEVWAKAKAMGYANVTMALEGVAKNVDAGRWREVVMQVGADQLRHNGAQWFILRNVRAVGGADLMRGSVAGHFTDSIDALVAARIAK